MKEVNVHEEFIRMSVVSGGTNNFAWANIGTLNYNINAVELNWSASASGTGMFYFTTIQEAISVCAERTDENRAVDVMLQIEDRDREMLRAGNKHLPDYYNEVQKEAMKRLAEKNIKEQVMNVEKEKVLKEKCGEEDGV